MTFEAQLGEAEKWIAVCVLGPLLVLLAVQQVRRWLARRDRVNRIARTVGVERRWYETDAALAKRMARMFARVRTAGTVQALAEAVESVPGVWTARVVQSDWFPSAEVLVTPWPWCRWSKVYDRVRRVVDAEKPICAHVFVMRDSRRERARDRARATQ